MNGITQRKLMSITNLYRQFPSEMMVFTTTASAASLALIFVSSISLAVGPAFSVCIWCFVLARSCSFVFFLS